MVVAMTALDFQIAFTIRAHQDRCHCHACCTSSCLPVACWKFLPSVNAHSLQEQASIALSIIVRLSLLPHVVWQIQQDMHPITEFLQSLRWDDMRLLAAFWHWVLTDARQNLQILAGTAPHSIQACCPWPLWNELVYTNRPVPRASARA